MKKYLSWETIFDIATLQEKVRQLEVEIGQDSFWQDNSKAQSILTQLNQYKTTIATYTSLKKAAEDIEVLLEIIGSENDPEAHLEELETEYKTFKSKLEQLEIRSMLSGQYDTFDCFFSLNAGAGGTDAQDWVEILLRMYTRWFDKKGFSYSIMDQTLGDEAGIKSVTLEVKGPFAYGLLKHENGVHRLVRISPFNANSKRQTSFAAVDVLPEIQNNTTELEIDPKDLRIDTFRSSGAGGQHVNKTDSAVRIVHIPTGLVAQSQHSRSQISNRETALNILKSRLLQRMIQEQKNQINDLRGDVSDISWGNQIRSYVFHPYKLVKDLRTDYERTDLQNVLDGDLDKFIYETMVQQKKPGGPL